MKTRLLTLILMPTVNFKTLMMAVLMAIMYASVQSWAQGNAPTVTVLTSILNPSFTGNNVTITATVTSSGNPVTLGAVSFFEGAQALATNVALNSSGQATLSKSDWLEGSHLVSANYSGATGFGASSGSFTQVVNNMTTVNGNTFCNTASGITINDNAAATPYPSNIFVSGLSGTITSMTVELKGLTHPSPSEIDLLLVSPTGQKFVLMSGVGGTNAVNNANIILSDAAASSLSNPLTSGTFRPTSSNMNPTFPSPAPAGPYSQPAPVGTTTLSSGFNGVSPNGTWSLYVADKSTGNSGSITGGWCLNFTVNCPNATTLYVNQAVASSGNGGTWPTAFKTLQEALTVANTCPSVTQIWVAKGTYYPDEGGSFANNDRTASFTMKNGVAIYGGFVGIEPTDYDLSLRNFADNETILSGDIDKDNAADAENAYHVIFNDFTSGTPLTNTAVLDGFTIKDGYANGSAPNSSGAGMYNNYASPIVRHCKFTRNTIVGNCYGGGMYNANSSPQVSDCSFSGNTGTGNSTARIHGIGMYNGTSSPTITNCVFTNNTYSNADYAYGSGIENADSSPVISGCSFTDNLGISGPGIYNRNSPLNISNCTFTNNQIDFSYGGVNGSGINTAGSTGTISNCSFVNNGSAGSISVEGVALVEITRCSFSGNQYGITLSEASPNINNCLFTSNRFGGVVVWYGASIPVITNCTFSENPESGYGSISNLGDNSPILKNCIIWGSGNSVYASNSKPLPTITHSIVKQASGVYTGTGNLNVDPLFVNSADPDGADNIFGTADDGLRLSVCSPAINAGIDAGAPATDILGNPRPYVGTASIADMGAYEFQGNPVAQPTASASTTTAVICAGNTINLSASGGDTFSWAGPSGSNFSSTAQEPSFTGSSTSYSGLYTVVVSNTGCTATATATVSVQVKANPMLNVTPPASQCGGTINLGTVFSSDGSLSYFTDNGFGSSAANPVSSSGPYYAKATGTNSCTATASVSITINTSATILAIPPVAQCGGTINLSTAFSTNGSLSYFTDAGFSSSAANPVVSSGIYYAKASVGTCTATASVSVTINPVPAASISPVTAQLCTGQTLNLSTNAGGSLYSWAASGGTFNSTTNQATFSSSIAGGFSISVTVANSFSCTASATASVTVVTQPTASISPSSTQIICQGQALNLTASGGGPYSWSGPSFSSTNAIVSLNTSSTSNSGVYKVTVGTGICTATATMSVQIMPSITVSVGFAPICLVGNPLNLSASGGDEYRWRGPNSFASNSATPTKAKTVAKDEGIYSVTVTGNGVCTVTSTIRVYYGIGAGEISITNRSPYCKGGPISLTANATGASSYSWSKQFGTTTFTGNPVTITTNAKTSDGGVYMVFVRGQNGCVEKQETLVSVSPVACIGTRMASEEAEEIDMQINAYPNPVANTLTVEVTLQKPSKLSLKLFNSIGKESGTWLLNEEVTFHKTELNMSDLTGGVYLLQGQVGKQKVVKRVVKIQY